MKRVEGSLHFAIQVGSLYERGKGTKYMGPKTNRFIKTDVQFLPAKTEIYSYQTSQILWRAQPYLVRMH
jgi:hypothetical protein